MRMLNDSFTANLEYYKVFYYVAKCGNITAAANELFLTQPSITKAIKNLEQQLGCTLFVRTKRGVLLTPEGKTLWRKIEPACRLIISAEKELEDIKSVNGGKLSIASTEMSFKTYVLPALESFLKDHPDIKIKFVNALNEQIIDMLKKGMVDLAILHEPFELDEEMDTIKIDTIEEYMVAGPRYAYLSEETRDISELKDFSFISMPEGSSTKNYLKDYFFRHNMNFEPDIELTTIELAVQAVESNFGIGILPEKVIREKIQTGKLFEVKLADKLPERRAYLITNRKLSPSITARAFIKEYLEREEML